ncbi:hypothetical protein NGR_c04420 [Sinorhizobium fredii NGR234]|uniref:Uncharacterized protein n=1 Tax=Sinorhizobium fredii (strain NBRC 101917 / NGR234) TaxID=394 RepID=C3MHB0_SINFN|nr:hypothetical protein NGR_c04420 [Sinorhizobium fredii NGR234]
MPCRSRRGRCLALLAGDFCPDDDQAEMSWGESLHQMNRHCGNPVAADRFNSSWFASQKAAA